MQNFNLYFNNELKQRCFNFSLNVIAFSDTPTGKNNAWIMDQLVHASLSIGANLAEARASSSKLAFKKFYEISLESAYESLCWLKLLRDSQPTDMLAIKKLIKEAARISKILTAGDIKLKRKDMSLAN